MVRRVPRHIYNEEIWPATSPTEPRGFEVGDFGGAGLVNWNDPDWSDGGWTPDEHAERWINEGPDRRMNFKGPMPPFKLDPGVEINESLAAVQEAIAAAYLEEQGSKVEWVLMTGADIIAGGKGEYCEMGEAWNGEPIGIRAPRINNIVLGVDCRERLTTVWNAGLDSWTREMADFSKWAGGSTLTEADRAFYQPVLFMAA